MGTAASLRDSSSDRSISILPPTSAGCTNSSGGQCLLNFASSNSRRKPLIFCSKSVTLTSTAVTGCGRVLPFPRRTPGASVSLPDGDGEREETSSAASLPGGVPGRVSLRRSERRVADAALRVGSASLRYSRYLTSFAPSTSMAMRLLLGSDRGRALRPLVFVDRACRL